MASKERARTRGGRSSAIAAVMVLAAAVSGCAGSRSEESGALRMNDPHESTNRDIHGFNRGVDQYFVRPVASVYDDVTPAPVRFLVRNALNHLELPRDFVSHLLSGELTAAGRTVLRFGANTVGGAGGLLDPATEFGLPKEDADFGMVLASWGFEEGVYMELPLLGPSTTRHTVGRVVDMFLAPTTFVGQPYAGPIVASLEVAEYRSTNEGAIDAVYYESVDSYVRARSVYYQNRRSRTEEGVSLDGATPIGEE